jgi:hypothetical protein
MNAKITVSSLVLAAAFAGNAFAESPIQANDSFAGAKSRAEVQAELGSYKKAGVNPWSNWYNPLRTFQSQTSRDAVVAEYLASRDQVNAFTAEDSGSAYLARTHTPGVAPSTLAGLPANNVQ